MHAAEKYIYSILYMWKHVYIMYDALDDVAMCICVHMRVHVYTCAYLYLCIRGGVHTMGGWVGA